MVNTATRDVIFSLNIHLNGSKNLSAALPKNKNLDFTKTFPQFGFKTVISYRKKSTVKNVLGSLVRKQSFKNEQYD